VLGQCDWNVNGGDRASEIVCLFQRFEGGRERQLPIPSQESAAQAHPFASTHGEVAWARAFRGRSSEPRSVSSSPRFLRRRAASVSLLERRRRRRRGRPCPQARQHQRDFAHGDAAESCLDALKWSEGFSEGVPAAERTADREGGAETRNSPTRCLSRGVSSLYETWEPSWPISSAWLSGRGGLRAADLHALAKVSTEKPPRVSSTRGRCSRHPKEIVPPPAKISSGGPRATIRRPADERATGEYYGRTMAAYTRSPSACIGLKAEASGAIAQGGEPFERKMKLQVGSTDGRAAPPATRWYGGQCAHAHPRIRS